MKFCKKECLKQMKGIVFVVSLRCSLPIFVSDYSNYFSWSILTPLSCVLVLLCSQFINFSMAAVTLMY